MVDLTVETVFPDGPSSNPTQPNKATIRRYFKQFETAVDAGLSNGGLVYDTKANMDADLAHDANASAWVIGDSTVANNGIYRKSGASGSGSWTRVGDLPYSFIRASNAGAGSANAIQATTSVPIPAADGAALITLNITANNTGASTVSFNGGSSLIIKTANGNDVEADYLVDGAVVSGFVAGSMFWLISEVGTAADKAAAEAAASAAVAAAASVAVKYAADDAALQAMTGSSDMAIFNGANQGFWLPTSDDVSTKITLGDPRYRPIYGDATGASGGFYQAESLPTGGFFADDANPARIIRINDRLLLGEAAINDGLSANVLTSWVGKTDDPSIDGPGQPNMAWIENQAVLAVSTPSGKGRIAVSGYGQTKGANAGSFTIGLNGFVYNNNDVNACAAEALYLDAKRANENVLGGTWCAEMAITNLGDFRRVGPWHSELGATMGVHIQAGGGTFTNGHSTDVSLGIRFANNGAAFDRLIVASGLSARDYTDANSEPYRIMISSPGGYAWEWVNGDDDLTASIKGVGLDTAQAVGLEIGRRQILLKDLVTGKTQFTAGGVANGVNHVSIVSGITGAGAKITATGDDSDVDLYLGGKNNGYVRTSSHLNMTGFDLYRSGAKVVGARKTGWGSPAGTLSRAAYTSYAGTTHGAAYSQTNIQTVDDELVLMSQTLAALLTDMHASTSGHGLIGPT